MNIRYHLLCGIFMDVAAGTKGVMTLFSVIPDLPLIFNEIRIRALQKPFVAEEVPTWIFNSYMTTHSLFFLILIYQISELGFIAYLVHILADWFTHTGRFSARPLYPFTYTVKFGREILK